MGMAPNGEKKRFSAHQKILLQMLVNFRLDVRRSLRSNWRLFSLFAELAKSALGNYRFCLFANVRIANIDIASVISPFSTISTAV